VHMLMRQHMLRHGSMYLSCPEVHEWPLLPPLRLLRHGSGMPTCLAAHPEA